jgi:hypothetical protein
VRQNVERRRQNNVGSALVKGVELGDRLGEPRAWQPGNGDIDGYNSLGRKLVAKVNGPLNIGSLKQSTPPRRYPSTSSSASGCVANAVDDDAIEYVTPRKKRKTVGFALPGESSSSGPRSTPSRDRPPNFGIGSSSSFAGKDRGSPRPISTSIFGHARSPAAGKTKAERARLDGEGIKSLMLKLKLGNNAQKIAKMEKNYEDLEPRFMDLMKRSRSDDNYEDDAGDKCGKRTRFSP